jgi:hypothetical protein
LTETICDNENVVIISSQATLPFDEKIAQRKTIVFETLVDPAVIKISAENLKTELFLKYGFLKPAIHEVQLTSVEKYYEPFIVINGKYLIDYYRKRKWELNVENSVTEVVFPFQRIEAKTTPDSLGKLRKTITLEGEERVQTENKASLTLNQSGKDIPLKDLPSAPSEKNPEETLAKYGVKQIPPNMDLSILRTRIFKRPTDVSWIANENFEVNERLVIYAPRFRASFKHTKTGKEQIAELDGLTGKLIRIADSRVNQASI